MLMIMQKHGYMPCRKRLQDEAKAVWFSDSLWLEIAAAYLERGSISNRANVPNNKLTRKKGDIVDLTAGYSSAWLC